MRLLVASILLLGVCVWQTSEALTKVPAGLADKISEDELDHVLELQRDIVAAHPDYKNTDQLSLNDIKKGLGLYLTEREIVSADVGAQDFEQLCREVLVEPCKKVALALDSSSAGALAFRLSFCTLVAQDEASFCESTRTLMASSSSRFGRS